MNVNIAVIKKTKNTNPDSASDAAIIPPMKISIASIEIMLLTTVE